MAAELTAVELVPELAVFEVPAAGYGTAGLGATHPVYFAAVNLDAIVPIAVEMSSVQRIATLLFAVERVALGVAAAAGFAVEVVAGGLSAVVAAVAAAVLSAVELAAGETAGPLHHRTPSPKGGHIHERYVLSCQISDVSCSKDLVFQALTWISSLLLL
ncbi:hypothetical protein AMATHDRAFT_50302 [Amanita thiersii Skay4041]|uniref:Uncharacterized protein n=1 Tax=Amanita thiersii Skay4041 TaxID=703135 RepID=A0A2A9NIA7_9AGAR|nr:hypothetical protein AMATHDRAFT_50302 [Amanita thiersii Skay4041]